MGLDFAQASAPGKVILVGEHFVVFGKAAVVMAINRRAYVTVSIGAGNEIKVRTKDFPEASAQQLEPIRIAAEKALSILGEKVGLNINVESEIPASAGLGSSAAVTVATAAAVGKLLEKPLRKEDIYAASFEAERFVHVNPSGVDPTIATYGGVILYERGKGFKPLHVTTAFPIVIGNTGLGRVTGDLVSGVGVLRQRHPHIINAIIDIGHTLAVEAADALEHGDLLKLGGIFNINHGLLSAVGVSCAALERLVYSAREAGALGAKLTGAGGGGCMLALATPETLRKVAEAIRGAGGTTVITRLSRRGVVA
mgnify:CR=1 FL=1